MQDKALCRQLNIYHPENKTSEYSLTVVRLKIWDKLFIIRDLS